MRVSSYLFGVLTTLAFMVACSSFVMDRSMPALEAGDYTLVLSACEAAPGHGMDICRVREGTKIESTWTLVVPHNDKEFLDGEIDVFFQDVHRSYPVTGSVINIPWKDFFKNDTWRKDFDGEALALVLIRFKTPEGVEEVVKFRGIAKLVVTAEGYDRLPIDSGFSGWKTKCQIEYSTAGRSALRCK